MLDAGKGEDSILNHLDQLVGWCSPLIASETLSEEEYIYFCEPDLDNEHTAIAVKPGRHPKWISALPLIFSKGGENND